jgi:hypothetical protein
VNPREKGVLGGTIAPGADSHKELTTGRGGLDLRDKEIVVGLKQKGQLGKHPIGLPGDCSTEPAGEERRAIDSLTPQYRQTKLGASV